MEFAAATVLYDSTGLAPAELEMGFLPRMHYDWDARYKELITSVQRLNREEA